jgi:SOS response regulatory protein OraA/RecX
MRKSPFPSRAEGTGERDPLEQALAALRHRERSAAEVDRYLAERGVSGDDRVAVLETLSRTSLLDDRRFAELRATTLGERGAGDALIRYELARAGVAADIVDEVVATLTPESERAARIVARRGAGPRTARYLAGKGFSEEVVRAVIAHSHDEPLG